MDSIRPTALNRLALPAASELAGGPAAAAPAGFGERISAALAAANGELVAAERAADGLARGEVGTLDAVVALSKADLTLRHLVTLRNRALESLQEVLRLPL